MEKEELNRIQRRNGHIANPLDNIDYNMLYMQKMAILVALENGGKMAPSALEGLLHLLDDIGNYGEKQGVFTYPPPEEEIVEDYPFKVGDQLLYDGKPWFIDKINEASADTDYITNFLLVPLEYQDAETYAQFVQSPDYDINSKWVEGADFLQHARQLDGSEFNLKPDKLLVISNTDGNIFVVDSYGHDDLLEEIGGTVLGVYTSPECPAVFHAAKVKGDVFPEGIRDNLDDGLHYRLAFGDIFDVIYTIRDPETGRKHETADLHQTAGEIFIHIGTNRYIEGALIFDRTHMLTPEEYFAGMRYNTTDSLARMTDAQLYEVKLGIEHDLDYCSLMRPALSPEGIRRLRTEVETAAQQKADPDHLYEATDYGPEELVPGFLSVSNFEKYPDRVCYIPENWDFADGRGITANDIILLCKGDQLKARMVFELCDWQFPSTILGEWDHADELALEELRAKSTCEPAVLSQQRIGFQGLMRDAKSRVTEQVQIRENASKHQR